MEDVKITMMPCINCEDVEKLIGASWDECRFGEMAENDSYVFVSTDDEAVQELLDSIDYYRKSRYFYPTLLSGLELELRFVYRMRERGYTDGILVNTNW